jgi:hypothetical protein
MIVDMIKDSRHEVPTVNMVININCIFIIDTNNDKKGNVIKNQLIIFCTSLEIFMITRVEFTQADSTS